MVALDVRASHYERTTSLLDGEYLSSFLHNPSLRRALYYVSFLPAGISPNRPLIARKKRIIRLKRGGLNDLEGRMEFRATRIGKFMRHINQFGYVQRQALQLKRNYRFPGGWLCILVGWIAFWMLGAY